ncbi:unnamed protein product [Trichogramma brassicae]|uniref:Uncharacterized protein n=1 Tax=Trichogramma brassicae TaxID=86971 RepID=A0A6H5I9Y1_9HYME|nr:unnamed protein product [Trichogramma brassicae]
MIVRVRRGRGRGVSRRRRRRRRAVAADSGGPAHQQCPANGRRVSDDSLRSRVGHEVLKMMSARGWTGEGDYRSAVNRGHVDGSVAQTGLGDGAHSGRSGETRHGRVADDFQLILRGRMMIVRLVMMGDVPRWLVDYFCGERGVWVSL